MLFNKIKRRNENGRLAVAQGFGGLNAAFNAGVGSLNLNIANQAAESRLQAQQLASQQQQCCCSVLRAEIYRKGLIYLSNPNDIQNIIDIGVLGLSIIMRK